MDLPVRSGDPTNPEGIGSLKRIAVISYAQQSLLTVVLTAEDWDMILAYNMGLTNHLISPPRIPGRSFG